MYACLLVPIQLKPFPDRAMFSLVTTFQFIFLKCIINQPPTVALGANRRDPKPSCRIMRAELQLLSIPGRGNRPLARVSMQEKYEHGTTARLHKAE